MSNALMAQPWSRERASDAEASGHARLLAVLLVDALETLGREPHGASAREIRDWACAGQADESAFSFARACDTLGLPPVRLRRRLGLRSQARRGGGYGFTRRGSAPRRLRR